jgi:hypothetical protein
LAPLLGHRLPTLTAGYGSFSGASIVGLVAFAAKPAALLLYMYIARLGFVDGMAGLASASAKRGARSVASLRAEAHGGAGDVP